MARKSGAGKAASSASSAEGNDAKSVKTQKESAMGNVPMPETAELKDSTALNSSMTVENPTSIIDEIVGAAKTDQATAFSQKSLAVLADLQLTDLGNYENARLKLKDAGVRVSAVDKAVAKINKDRAKKDEPQADTIYGLIKSVQLFRTSNSQIYADIWINGHRESHPIQSRRFRRWAGKHFFDQVGSVPNLGALDTAIELLGSAVDLPEHKVSVRVAAGTDGCIYLDLANSNWEAVEIGPSGWRVVSNPPVRFRRSDGMLPLPTPSRGGTLDELYGFLNVTDQHDRVLVVSWIATSFMTATPQPALVIIGPHGAAKSSLTKSLGELVDPNALRARLMPREDRDLFIAASNRHILCFDNTSALSDAMSDTTCQLITGGGFGARGLYTNGEEFQCDAMGTVIINCIDNVVTRPDLADRSIFLTVPKLPATQRRTEEEFWAAFKESHPRMLGTILDAVVTGLRRLPDVREASYPRMADFAKFAIAAETAYWPEGSFRAAYNKNIDGVVDDVIDNDPVAESVVTLMSSRTIWQGTADDCLTKLKEVSGNAKHENYPKNPRALSSRLKRTEPFLHHKGIEVSHHRSNNITRTRQITFTVVSQDILVPVQVAPEPEAA